jgi:hypothetical protein
MDDPTAHRWRQAILEATTVPRLLQIEDLLCRLDHDAAQWDLIQLSVLRRHAIARRAPRLAREY